MYARRVLGLGAAPEFEKWLEKMQIMTDAGHAKLSNQLPPAFAGTLRGLATGTNDG
ncbi:hypothetical protein [Methylophaga sp. UBA1918]|uniref:hypothetical protein n=1 Tax=Methylophaga sp. UBA1918 TaxID=1946869 RepID=UPI0039C93EED